MREISQEEYCHENLGERFESSLSHFDTRCRVEVLVDQFLVPQGVAGKRILDVGCGLGFFSKRLVELGGEVIGCDIGARLLQRTSEFAGCRTMLADALTLTEVFDRESFDMIVSSECIEHTPDPALAISQMAELLRPNGLLSLSTPNLVWQPVVRMATRVRLRSFDGHENFTSWRMLRHRFSHNKLEVIDERGLHLFPFQFRLHRLSSWCDVHFQSLRGVMINICMLGKKLS